jgi:SAM-dependent methyltransferase
MSSSSLSGEFRDSTQTSGSGERSSVCDLCGAANVVEVLALGRRALVECSGCGLVRLDPITTSDELHAVYEEGDYYTTRPPVISDDFAERLRVAVLRTFWGYGNGTDSASSAVLRILLRPLKYRVMPVPFPRGLPVLDIGCGNGQRLLELQHFGHTQLYGVEPTGGAARQAQRATEATIYPTTLEEAPLQPAHFGLVIMNQVLEHVPSPRTTLRNVRSLLRADGTLYLTVPNFGSLEARVFGEHWAGLRIPEHLHHFTPRALRRLIEESGFRIVTWRTDTVLSITQETIGTWERASGGGWWRRLFVRLPGYMLAPATLAADLCGRGQMLRIVAVCK